MPIGIMGRKSLALIDRASRCLPTRKEKAYIHLFVLFPSVTETPKTSIKDLEPPLPIILIGIVAYVFVGQPLSKQLYLIPQIPPCLYDPGRA